MKRLIMILAMVFLLAGVAWAECSTDTTTTTDNSDTTTTTYSGPVITINGDGNIVVIAGADGSVGTIQAADEVEAVVESTEEAEYRLASQGDGWETGVAIMSAEMQIVYLRIDNLIFPVTVQAGTPYVKPLRYFVSDDGNYQVSVSAGTLELARWFFD